MDCGSWLKKSVKILSDSGVPSAKLDTEILLTDTLKKDRSWLHAHPEHVLRRSDLRKLDEQIERRAGHEPIAYILGQQEFFGRNFKVSPDTLTPRPETETMIEMALDLLEKSKVSSIADIGTGSGCIIITLSLECSSETTSFTGYELSKSALLLSEYNAKKLKSSAKFQLNDITNNGKQDWQNAEMTVANLPYVPDNFHINLAASHEPPFAIFGGGDGLDYYRHLFQKLSTHTKFVLTESLPTQHTMLEKIADADGYLLENTQDFIQLFVKK